MATIKGNYAFRADELNEQLNDGDTVIGNCAQIESHTKIGWKDEKWLINLTFHNCNLDNCQVPPDAKLTGYSAGCQKEFCSHEHPGLVKRGLKQCAEDCVHRVSGEKQWVEIDEKEYKKEREKMRELDPTSIDVRITKQDDIDEITSQFYEKLVYIYKDKNIRAKLKL